jgi:hypothetical protein
MTRFEHTPRRHPLCPQCRYDLVSTVTTGTNVCPECGYAFERKELRHEVLPGDWTFGKGMRTAAGWLVLKTIIAGAAWCGVLWLSSVIPLIYMSCYGAALALAIGAALGAIIGARLVDQAGFAGPVVTGLGIAAAAVAILGGSWVVSPLLGPFSLPGCFVPFTATLAGAIGAILWFTVADA